MHLLNDLTMQAICWTLLHSVWEGLILAILAGIAILFTGKSSAAVRYNLLSLLFIMFLVCIGITFEMQLQHAIEHAHVNETALQPVLTGIQYPVLQNTVSGQNQYFAVFIDYFNAHASMVVMIWLIVLSFQFVRLFGNYLYTQRIRNYKTHEPPAYWKIRLRVLAERLHIPEKVALLESEIIKVPVLVGFFKPVILFPFSLMSQLPPEQVEAVLLHELAHIRRKDYFVNLVQRIAEIIFFFNPGLVWVSSLIRDERENCCDDIAIGETNARKEYINALISFEEYHHLTKQRYAIAFAGRKNHLLERVKRIISKNNKTLSNMEKVSLVSCMVIVVLATFAFQQNTPNQVPASAIENKTVETKSISDSIPDKNDRPSTTQFVLTIDGIKYKYLEMEGKFAELYANGKLIPKDQLSDYQREVIAKIKQEQGNRRAKLSAENEKLQLHEKDLQERSNKLMAETEALNQQKIKANDDAMKELMNQQSELNMKMDYLRKAREELFMDRSNKKNFDEQAQLNKERAELFELQSKIKEATLSANSKSFMEADNQEKKEFLQQKKYEIKAQLEALKNNQEIYEKMNWDARSLAQLAEPVIPSSSPSSPSTGAGLQLVAPPSPEASEGLLRLNNGSLRLIINALLDEKIIESADSLSVILNQQTFIINGVVQPQNIQDQFKKRFLKGSNDHVIFSRRGGSTHTDINVDNN
jgi:bla regulator protein blaR1